MLAAAFRLSAPLDPSDCAIFDEIESLIDSSKLVIGLCVQDNYLDELIESFKRMVTFAESGSAEEFSAEKQSFIEAVTHIRDTERLSAENIL